MKKKKFRDISVRVVRIVEKFDFQLASGCMCVCVRVCPIFKVSNPNNSQTA